MQTRPETPSSPKARIRFDRVVLERGGARVFDGLDLDLVEPRIALIGDNGSGKSSLLRLANGLLLPDEGSVYTCGLETRANRAAMPGLAGFLFQTAEHQILFPTVGEEICFGLREAGASADAATRHMRQLLSDHGWEGWEHRPVQDLSDGQKQRLCILAVLAMQPRVLLLDEPFASLDWPSRRRFAQDLAALPQQIVMASHDFELIESFDRAIWLSSGRIRADGTPREVVAAYIQSHRPDMTGVAAQ